MNPTTRMAVYVTVFSAIGFVGALAAGVPFSFTAPETIYRDVPPALIYIVTGGATLIGTLQLGGVLPEKWGFGVDGSSVSTAGKQRLAVEMCAIIGFASFFGVLAAVQAQGPFLGLIPWYAFVVLMVGCGILAKLLQDSLVGTDS